MNSVVGLNMRALVDHISGQGHAMAGATGALTTALAVALGEACVRITAALSATDWSVADELAAIRQNLLTLADEDANAIARFAALRNAGEELAGQEYLCELPRRVGIAAVDACRTLQMFRPHVAERVRDDLEIAIVLLAGAARAAMLLLDSNLRIWPDPVLLAQFEPQRAALEQAVNELTPASRLR